MSWWPGSMARRLAALFAALALLVFGISALLLYGFLNDAVEHERQHAHRTKLDLVVQMMQRARAAGPVGAQWPRIRADLDELHRNDRATYFWVYCREPGQAGPSACSTSALQLQELAPARALTPMSYEQVELQHPHAPPDARLQLLSKDVPGLPAGEQIRVVVGTDGGRSRHVLDNFGWLIGLISLGGALATALLGGALVRQTLKPMRALSETARRLGPEDLSRRLVEPPPASELHALVSALNGALDRMQEAFVQLETFNANVAHELRTPLTTLIGATQVALARPRPADELREVLAGNLEDAEQLAAMVRDMLFLARADHGARAEALQALPWQDLCADTAEFFAPLLEDEGRSLSVHGAALGPVNPGLFKRGLSNLIANALQYGEAGTPIRVELSTEGPLCRLEVVNSGPALPEATLKRMFDRFYRADAARGRKGGHAGLGLAIVKAIATMHGGQVQARCEPGRVRIGWVLPGAEISSAADPGQRRAAGQNG